MPPACPPEVDAFADLLEIKGALPANSAAVPAASPPQHWAGTSPAPSAGGFGAAPAASLAPYAQLQPQPYAAQQQAGAGYAHSAAAAPQQQAYGVAQLYGAPAAAMPAAPPPAPADSGNPFA